MKSFYTTIPVKLCEYALVNRKANHLMLYVYLKQVSSGQVTYSNSNYQLWATDIDKSERWVRDTIKWLVKKRWVTLNTNTNSLRIVSYEKLLSRLELDSKSAFVFEEEDFSHFKEFCCAGVITHYMKLKRFSDKKRCPVSIMGDTSKSHYFYPKGFYTIPISYLATCLGVSNSTANNYKKQAKKAGFIAIKRQVRTLENNSGDKIGVEFFPIIQSVDNKLAGRYRKGRKYLKIVEPDLIQSEITSRRKRFR